MLSLDETGLKNQKSQGSVGYASVTKEKEKENPKSTLFNIPRIYSVLTQSPK